MGSFSVPVSSALSISEAFSDMAPSMKSFMKVGFANLSRISPDRFDLLVVTAIQAVESPSGVDEKMLSTTLNLPSDEVGPLLSVISFMTVLTARRTETPAEIVAAASNAGLVPTESRAAAIAFSEAIRARQSGVLTSLDKSRLASAILPSLMSFETLVDVRLKFDSKSEVQTVVPVVVAHLDTDAEHEHLWFQMQRADVEKVLQQLNRVVKELDSAEKWAAGPKSK